MQGLSTNNKFHALAVMFTKSIQTVFVYKPVKVLTKCKTSRFSSLPILHQSPGLLLSKKNTSFYSSGSNTKDIKGVKTPVNNSGDFLQVRLEKRIDMLEKNLKPYAYNFTSTHNTFELQELYKELAPGDENADVVSISGRVLLKRNFGKLMFLTIKDHCGTVQIYVDFKELSADIVDNMRKYIDMGDIIGVKGSLKRTNKGELSVKLNTWDMLTKSIQMLPEKHAGLQDVNKRYRQRHVDMIVNNSVFETLKTRSEIIQNMRAYLGDRGYLEVETPVLSSQAGGADAKPFVTHHNALDMPLTLRIATELYLKRLIVGGFNKIFEIGKIFRNEGISPRHNPEFTSIELYEAYTDYEDMMRLMENMTVELCTKIHGGTLIPYQEHDGERKPCIDLSLPWKRISMVDVVKEAFGPEADFYSLIINQDLKGARDLAIACGVDASLLIDIHSPGEVLNLVFEEKIESQLIQPTFVTDYPIEISPLSKRKRDPKNSYGDKYFVERFEMFMVGREHANGFSELTDPIEQRERFQLQVGIACNIFESCVTVLAGYLVSLFVLYTSLLGRCSRYFT